MAVSTHLYRLAHKNRWTGGGAINWLTDTIKVALCTSSYTPGQDTHQFFSDITNEITGTGYTAGGKAITSPAVTLATPDIKFTAANESWAGATFTARYAIVYKDTGTPSTAPLICYVDYGADVVESAGTHLITWDASGVFKITPA